jgi:hypothetical protein
MSATFPAISTADNLPQLAPPGAGLPPLELFVARNLFYLKCFQSRARAAAKFAREEARILALVKNCSQEHAARRVLIQRLAGMEDSSRNWSVWMTLEHLRIVNTAIGNAIRSLGKGKVPTPVVNTAAVKPSVDVKGDVVQEFTRSCQFVVKCVAAVPDLKTPARYRHPWFGPLDAAGWHVLAGFHTGLHRAQIERIVAGL